MTGRPLGEGTLSHEAHGPVGATPVVLVHGLGCSSADWARLVAALADRHRVIAPDLGGHGGSPRLRGRPSIAALAGDVAALLTALDLPPAHVVGLSLGGCVALALALDHRERVRSLVLVNAFARPSRAGPRGSLRFLARLGLLACAPMRVVAAHVARGLFPRPEQGELYAAAVASLSATARGTYLRCLWALGTFDVRGRLPEVQCPTLVIAGAEDATVPMRSNTLLHRAIPGAELLVIPGSGHATPHDQPERFNGAVRAFVAAH